jgi:hypothetical protein
VQAKTAYRLVGKNKHNDHYMGDTSRKKGAKDRDRREAGTRNRNPGSVTNMYTRTGTDKMGQSKARAQD